MHRSCQLACQEVLGVGGTGGNRAVCHDEGGQARRDAAYKARNVQRDIQKGDAAAKGASRNDDIRTCIKRGASACT